MTCFFCKGDLCPDFTTYFQDLGGCYVIIKNVPCEKGSQCGEVTYTFAVLQRIEQIISEVKNALKEVTIINYTAA